MHIITAVLFFSWFTFTTDGREFVALYATASLVVRFLVGGLIAEAIIEIPRLCGVLVGFMGYELSEHSASLFKVITGKTTTVRADGYDFFRNDQPIHNYSKRKE